MVTRAANERALHVRRHPTPVRLDGDLADAEVTADLLVQTARHHQRHHLALTAAERGVPIRQSLSPGFVQVGGLTAVERTAHGAQQGGFAERLGQEIRRAHCAMSLPTQPDDPDAR
jgi:hypothetical protein